MQKTPTKAGHQGWGQPFRLARLLHLCSGVCSDYDIRENSIDMNKKIAIIADDLTGATDSGVQFARKGLKTAVVFDVDQLPASSQGADAVAIETDSRAIAPNEARERARQAARGARLAGLTHIFKKVDSTLRGNLGPEIDGIMDEISFDLAVVAPAFPKLGRTTVAGRHLLKGVPLEETEIGRDPKCPVRESRLERLLGTQSCRKTGLVELAVLRQGPEAVRAQVATLRGQGVELVIFDAEADTDLQRIAEAMAGSPYNVLWVGSAGLADFLPAALGLTGGVAGPVLAPGTLPVMLVAGSVSPVTRAQVAAVRHASGVASIELNPLQILTDGDACAAELARCHALLQLALAEGQDLVFTSATAPEQVLGAQQLGETLGLDGTAVSNRIALILGQVAARVIGAAELQGLILTGGDTAKAVCRRLGVAGLEVCTELEPGVPLSRFVGSRPVPVVTKAGAFGTEETLLRALRTLKGGI